MVWVLTSHIFFFPFLDLKILSIISMELLPLIRMIPIPELPEFPVEMAAIVSSEYNIKYLPDYMNNKRLQHQYFGTTAFYM